MADPAAPGLLRVGVNAINFTAFANSPTARFAYTPLGGVWTGCIMKQHACLAQTASGNQCSRLITGAFPYCWQHLQFLSHLAVSPTTVAVGGIRLQELGLFAYNPQIGPAARVFARHAFIANMFGEFLTGAQVVARYPGNEVPPFVSNAGLGGGHRRDSIEHACVRPVGAFTMDCLPATNQSIGIRGVRNCQYNAEIVNYAEFRFRSGLPRLARERNYYPVLIATMDIINQDEIFTNYGVAYWGPGAVHQANTSTERGLRWGNTRKTRF
jgi:hypothetical protein